MKGWYGNRQAHSLASKGIKTSTKLYARGDFTHNYEELINNILDEIDFNLLQRVGFNVDSRFYEESNVLYSYLTVYYNDGNTKEVVIGDSDNIDDINAQLEHAKSIIDPYILSANGKKNKYLKAEGKRRFRKGEFIEVMDDYSFIEPHMGRQSNEPVTVKKGDIGQITYTHKDDLDGVHITFKTKDGNVYFDSTDKRFTSGKFRKLKMSKPKDKIKINTIFYEEEYR